jgi:hypothetical protein
MRRIDLLFAPILTGIVFIALYCTNTHRNLIRNDNAQVIEASPLSFFKKADWNDMWDKGNLIQTDPAYSYRPLLTFTGSMAQVVADMGLENTPPQKLEFRHAAMQGK